jgi:SpoVK/Ycf46/Vps4 family AAA+-type ATPase
VEQTVGYCGADMKALCSEATLVALRRAYPQVYTSSSRLKLDKSQLTISVGDFAAALQKVVPSSRRSETHGSVASGQALDHSLRKLLLMPLQRAKSMVEEVFPYAVKKGDGKESGKNSVLLPSADWVASFSDVLQMDLPGLGAVVGSDNISGLQSLSSFARSSDSMWSASAISGRAPRMLIQGPVDAGQLEVASDVLHRLEPMPVFALDNASLLSDVNTHTEEQALVSRLKEARQRAPSVVFLPDLNVWWEASTDQLKNVLVMGMTSASRGVPVLWLCTHTISPKLASEAQCDPRLARVLAWFHMGDCVLDVTLPDEDARREFAHEFFESIPLLPAFVYATKKRMHDAAARVVELADDTDSPEYLAALEKAEARTAPTVPTMQLEDKEMDLLRQLRIFFRAVLHELSKERRFQILWKPVDPDVAPDYYDIVRAPMDLETMRCKVDEHYYTTKEAFTYDIQQVTFNAKLYNPANAKDSRGRSIVHACNSLIDVVETHAYDFRKKLGFDIFKRASDIAKRRGLQFNGNRNRKKLPVENRKFYQDMLDLHAEIKDTMGEEHPSFGVEFSDSGESDEEEIVGSRRRKQGKKVAKFDSLAQGGRRSSRVLGVVLDDDVLDLSNLPDAVKVTTRSPTKSRMDVDESVGEGDAPETAAESKVGDDEHSQDRSTGRDVDMGESEGEDTAAAAMAPPVLASSAAAEKEEVLAMAVVTMEDAAALESEHPEHCVPMEHSSTAAEGIRMAPTEEPEAETGLEKEGSEAAEEDGEGEGKEEKEKEEEVVEVAVAVAVVEEPEAEEAVDEEEPAVFEQRADVLLLEVAMLRARALWPAQQSALRSNFLAVTRDMSVGMCQDLMALLSRKRREFNDHFDFDRLMQDLMVMRK